VSRIAVAIVAVALARTVSGAPADPSAAGPFAVGVTTLTFVDATRGRTLVTEVWYPGEIDGRDVPVRRGRHPFVLLAHGNCGFRTNYEYLTVPLASRGFVVAAPDFPGINQTACDAGQSGDRLAQPARDLRFLRDAFHDPTGPAGAFVPALRPRGTGLVGHSLGGLAVVNAARNDDDMRAVVALAPFATDAQARSFNNLRPRRAVLVAAATGDTTLPPAIWAEPFFSVLPAPSYFVEIMGGSHGGFTDMDGHLAPGELARQETITRRYATAFLEAYLAHHARYRRFLTPSDAAAQTGVELTTRPR